LGGTGRVEILDATEQGVKKQKRMRYLTKPLEQEEDLIEMAM
jgi:hypothetical protein